MSDAVVSPEAIRLNLRSLMKIREPQAARKLEMPKRQTSVAWIGRACKAEDGSWSTKSAEEEDWAAGCHHIKLITFFLHINLITRPIQDICRRSVSY